MPAKTPDFRFSPNAPDTMPTNVGPPEQPISPPNANNANIAVPPFGRTADALLNVPGHIISTDSPQIAQAIGTFVNTMAFPIGISTQMTANIFQFSMPTA